ncbi:hypothetical protein N2W52_001993 [Clostridium perfringens]|nr:hypothetical protein [Clostridium perfringens]MDK0983010.1 hypothetical protein [Clostridium perfringens]
MEFNKETFKKLQINKYKLIFDKPLLSLEDYKDMASTIYYNRKIFGFTSKEVVDYVLERKIDVVDNHVILCLELTDTEARQLSDNKTIKVKEIKKRQALRNFCDFAPVLDKEFIFIDYKNKTYVYDTRIDRMKQLSYEDSEDIVVEENIKEEMMNLPIEKIYCDESVSIRVEIDEAWYSWKN